MSCARPHNCPDCPFNSRTVGTRGPNDARIVIVGESPGSMEVRTGQPFTGPSGDLLRHLLDKAKIPENNVFITNSFRCLPPRSKDEYGNKIKDGKINEAAKACRKDLIAQITHYPRNIIIALGSSANRTLRDKWNVSITSVRGQIFEFQGSTHGVMPTFHPAHVLRNPGLLPQVESDFVRAKQLLDGHQQQTINVDYVVASHAAIATDIAAIAKRAKRETVTIMADIETTGLDRHRDKIRMIGYIPEYEISSNNNKRNTVRVVTGKTDIDYLLKTMPTRNVQWCWHNGKFDTSMLRAKNINRAFARVDEDTMLLSYLLDEIGGRHGLEQCVTDHLRLPNFKNETDEWRKANRATFADIPFDMLARRNARDVVYMGLLWRILSPKVNADAGLKRVYNDLMIPGSNALATIELNGIPLDQTVIAQNERTLSTQIASQISLLQSIVGSPEFNPASPKDVVDYIRGTLKLRVKSTQEEELKKHKDKYPFIRELLEFRGTQKLLGTYVSNYKKYGKRVHTTFKLIGTVTGRLSSTGPNVQNTPKDAMVRAQYAVPKGRRLLEVDYQQAELKSLAVLSQDPVLLDIFKRGEDLHTSQAAFVYGKAFTSLPKVLPNGDDNPAYDKIRRRAKTVNFGIIYGVTPPTIAEREGIPLIEAIQLVKSFGARFQKAWEFIQWCRSAPANNITLKTVFGRKRRYRIITSQTRHGIENEASNFPHQSMCSDFTLRSAIEVDQYAQSARGFPGNAQQINIIHDANLFEIDDNDKAMYELYAIVKKIMQKVPADYGITEIPFTVDAKMGYSWNAMKKVKELD